EICRHAPQPLVNARSKGIQRPHVAIRPGEKKLSGFRNLTVQGSRGFMISRKQNSLPLRFCRPFFAYRSGRWTCRDSQETENKSCKSEVNLRKVSPCAHWRGSWRRLLPGRGSKPAM